MAQVNSILASLLFKDKPELPPLEEIDFGEEQRLSIANNQAALPAAQKLASEVNRFNQEEILKQFRNSIPNFDFKLEQVAKNYDAGLKGEIPGDVQDQVQNNAAARALAGGYGGTGMHGNLLARDLGLTSYDIAQKNMDSFSRWIGTAGQALNTPLYNVAGNFISPAQQAAFDVSERNTRWNYNWFKAQHDAQPEPWEQAVIGLLDWVANTGLSVATMGIGNVMGGGGFMGGGAGAAGVDTASASPSAINRLLPGSTQSTLREQGYDWGYIDNITR